MILTHLKQKHVEWTTCLDVNLFLTIVLTRAWLNDCHLCSKNRCGETGYGGSGFQRKWDTTEICTFHWLVCLFDEELILPPYYRWAMTILSLQICFQLQILFIFYSFLNRVKFWKRIKKCIVAALLTIQWGFEMCEVSLDYIML